MIYPWQQNQWQQIHQQIAQGRLPHALLFKGAEGLGKLDFAHELTASLLCKQLTPSGQSCGTCEACKLIAAGTHPDFLWLEPEEDNKPIKVDQVRELCASLSMTSQFGGYKVAVIALADNMNINAANSLLKTLEEPTENTVLILVSSRPHRLPITIRSRCQNVLFQQPESGVAEQWMTENNTADAELMLSLSHGSPLLACKLAASEVVAHRKSLIEALLGVANNQAVTEHAAKLSKAPGEYLLSWLYDWISDLLKLHQGGAVSRLVHSDYQNELQQMVAGSNQQGLFGLLDEVIQLRRVQSIPLNTQMLWEDLLISWNRQIKQG
ncbi:MAG: DNA polymerase III subunit delta' [Gammaproteobacteria bacterium]|nr:DNA polymerase III subunit delta' [Gammaproteobacteria bacterium]